MHDVASGFFRAGLAASLLLLATHAQCGDFSYAGDLPKPSNQSGVLAGTGMALHGDVAALGTGLFDTAVVDRGQVLVFERSGGRWFGVAEFSDSSGIGGGGFGDAIALSRNFLVVGAPGRDFCGGQAAVDRGCTFIYRRTPSGWATESGLVSPFIQTGAREGHSVSVSGDYAITGAPFAGGIGTALVYKRSDGGVWSYEAALNVAQQSGGDRAGWSVAIEGDIAFVGTPGDNIGQGASQGTVAVFQRVGTVWTERQKLVATDGVAGDEFGASVAVSGDNVLVGAPGRDAGAVVDAGGVYVYRITPSPFLVTEQGVSPSLPLPAAQNLLLSASPATGDVFGSTLSVSGETAVVGAPSSDAGAAHVLARNGNLWQVRSRIAPPDLAAGDNFGARVAISGDALLVSAPADDVEGVMNAGSVRVFFEDAEVAALPDAITADRDGAASDFAGTAVSASAEWIVFGNPSTDATGPGEVLVAQRPAGANAPAPMNVVARLRHPNRMIGDKFGTSVDVSDDGNAIVIGVPGRLGGTGEVLVFRKPNGSAWVDANIPDATIAAPAPANGVTPRAFGNAVAFDALGAVAVGAPESQVGAQNSAGATFEFVPAGPVLVPAPTGAMRTSDVPGVQGAFGWSLDVSQAQLLVGEPFRATAGTPGRAHLFVRTASAKAPAAARASAAKGISGDKFGTSVSLSRGVAMVGAPGSDSAMLFDVGAGTLRFMSELKPTLLTESAGFSVDVMVDVASADVVVAMGAPDATRGFRNGTGATYFFRRSRSQWESAMPITADAELSPSQVQTGQRHGTAVLVDEQGSLSSAPGRDVFPIASPARPDQGEVETYRFDRLFGDGFE